MPLLIDFINRQFIHYPPRPTTSFTNQTAIVTGSSSGLGLQACIWLIRLGASRVILACRNTEKAHAATNVIQSATSCDPAILQVWELDMSSYASVQAFSEKVKSELPRLDVVLAKAGIGTRKFRMTEGNEETMTTNVISTTLLACLLHPKLQETAMKYKTTTYLTVTGSELYEQARFTERKAPAGRLLATMNEEGKSDMGDRYNVSKLMILLVVKQLAAMAPVEETGVVVNIVAPGFCQSELGRDYMHVPGAKTAMKILARPPEVGARTLVHGAIAGRDSHGKYLPDCVVKHPAGLTKGKEGAELQERVWMELRDKLEGIREGVTVLG